MRRDRDEAYLQTMMAEGVRPEVYGHLSLARRHLDRAWTWNCRHRHRQAERIRRKHRDKAAQHLARAASLMERGASWPA